MNRASLLDRFGADEPDVDDRIADSIVDALSANDRIIEIRPVERSRGMGLKGLLLLAAGAIGFAYWVQNSQKPNDLFESVKERTANRTDQAAESIEEGSEAASDRIEEGSERAGKAVEDAGKKVAERTEEAGEKAKDEMDKDAKGSTKA